MIQKTQKLLISYNIKFYRTELGLSQEDLARSANLSRRSLQLIEAGEGNPTLESLISLADFLKVGLSRLVALRACRLNEDFPEFLKRFTDKFDSSKNMIGIRTVDGLVIWANQAVSDHWNGKISYPFNIKSLVESNRLNEGILNAQLGSEQNGHAWPYLSECSVDPSKSSQFYRVHPILVYPKSGSAPRWTAAFSQTIEEQSEEAFCEFIAKFLDLIFPNIS